MEIQKSIEQLAVKRGRAVAKADAVYDSEKEARDAESSATSAKDPKDFDKQKKECLSSVSAGEKATAAWEKEMGDWDTAIKALEGEIAAEKQNIEQQQREVDAVNKAIDEINADIKAYNDDLLLGERDPRARPYVLKKSAGTKLAAALTSLNEASTLAANERKTWNNQKEWVGKPIKALGEVKGRISKAKFTKPK